MRKLILLAALFGFGIPIHAEPPPGDLRLRLVDGKFGKALDARTSPVTIDGNERFRTPPLTVECWANLASKKHFNVLVASDHKSSGKHWEIYSYAGSGAFSAYLPGMQPSELMSKVDICDGQWHYLAMTHDGKKVRLFVDAKEVLERTVEPRRDAKPEPGPLTIGMALHGKDLIGCDGTIDDVRISSTLRTIERVPTKPLALDLNTIGLWRFDSAEAADVDPAWTPRPAEGDSPPWERATDKDWIDARFQSMDTGPFLDATFRYPRLGGKEMVYKGTAIKVGDKPEAAVLYDRGQLRFAAGWTPRWLVHSSTRFGLLNTPSPVNTPSVVTLSGPGCANPEGTFRNGPPATAPLPSSWAKYHGLHVHGRRVVLSYSMNGRAVLDSPWVEAGDGITALTRTLLVEPGKAEIRLRLLDCPGGKAESVGADNVLCLVQGSKATAVGIVGKPRFARALLSDADISVGLGAREEPCSVKFLLWSGDRADLPRFEKLVRESVPPEDVSLWTKPGPTRWKPLVTKGEVGKDGGPFAIDTLTIPYDNPYKALFFVSGIDFLPNGDAAVCTAHGDVWLVSGIDAKLEKLTWRRFATGLYQPLGLKVVDGKIVVLERGQLTRLHDLNNDGEADFYENLCNDWHTGGGEHSFDTCLETDPDGNFYFFKTGDTDTPSGGCLLRVPRDGSKAEIFCTGFRHPIGLGVSPTGIVTGADQEGNWMPATRIDIYRKGGFYGDMRAHHRAKPPETYDPPLCWLPRQVDNSAGGQVWVPEGKWGPLGGKMLHLSFGKCRMMLMLPQEVDGVSQAVAVDLGMQFLSGIARGRFNPRDGHLYVVGLQGWQTAAVKDGCLQRVRWTGKPLTTPIGLSVHANGIKLTFAQDLDRKSAENVRNFGIDQWNYHWSADYGSKRWSLARPNEAGQDRVPITSARLLDDGRSVFLETKPGPVMQMQIRYGLQTAAGKSLAGAVYNTIHRTGAALR